MAGQNEDVDQFIARLNHPLEKEIRRVRAVI